MKQLTEQVPSAIRLLLFFIHGSSAVAELCTPHSDKISLHVAEVNTGNISAFSSLWAFIEALLQMQVFTNCGFMSCILPHEWVFFFLQLCVHFTMIRTVASYFRKITFSVKIWCKYVFSATTGK